MEIDTIALAIGGVVALVIGAAIFAFRDRIGQLRMSFIQGAASTRERLNRNIDTRYREAVIQQANGLHVAGHLVPLEQIAILPRFYTLPEPYNPMEEEPEIYTGPLSFIPLTPDWSQAMSSYQIPGIPLERLLRGEDNIALLGAPGSGRTSALALMSILAARQKEDNQSGGLLDVARMPIYFHMADLDLNPQTWGLNADPIDPVLAAAGIRMRSLAEQSLHAVQGQFTGGYGLILADGWDELPPDGQAKSIDFLRTLISTYPGNRVVVAGPVRGFKPLQELGLAPAFIVPWGQLEFSELGRLWSTAWPDIGGTNKEPASEPDQEVVRRAARGNRARSPLDVTLKIWATFAGDDPGQGRRGWYSAYINRTIPSIDLRPALERIGERDLATATQAGVSIEEANAVTDAARSTIASRTPMTTPDFIYFITNQTRLIIERVNKRMTFAQPVIAAYLAAESLGGSPFVESLLDGRLQSDMTIAFLSQIRDITPYVTKRLAEYDDIERNKTLAMAMWATDASPTAAWRGDVFKQLAQLLLSPSQFPLVRERTMAALVASRDSNVGFIFREGLKSPDSRIRTLSAIGLGGLGDPETVTLLGEAIIDQDPSVVVAATLALGAIGTKPALDFMIQVMLTGFEMARRAAAEMFAGNLAGEGHDLLKEAIKEQDYMTRRAAVYGLQRVQEDWVVPLLDEAQLRDDQWLVRSAATNALEELRKPSDIAPKHRPRPEESPWLGSWLADRDDNLQSGEFGVGQLIRALLEGDDAIRFAAAETLASLGPIEGITPLYAALRDNHAEVRDAAYRALAAIGSANDRALPGVM